jgi:uncharacterized membrane protein YdjX (TVP38/TMEM64 family)
MSNITITVILIVAGVFLALLLARRSARAFMEQKRKKHHGKQAVRLNPTPHGRARKK